MNTMKKISVLLLGTLLVGCLAGCNADQTQEPGKETAKVSYEAPSVNVDYLEGQTDLSKTVDRANELANGVQAYYENSDRQNYIIENQNMQMTHALSDRIFVTSLKNRHGGEYLFNTMDALSYLTVRHSMPRNHRHRVESTQPDWVTTITVHICVI